MLCLRERQRTLEEGEEVVSDLSQSGIRVYLGFVGGLRKGICNFPPLIYTAVYNSYLSPLPLGPFVLIFLFYPSDFNFSYPNVITDLVYMQHKRLCTLFEARTREITRFWLFYFQGRVMFVLDQTIFFCVPSPQISVTQRSYLYCVNPVIPRRKRKSWRRRRKMIWSWRVLCWPLDQVSWWIITREKIRPFLNI